LGVLVLLVCGGLLVYMHRSAKRAAAYGDCRNNLRQIGLAMHNYHDKYGCFPPAYVPDENGKPKHSWRVLLLPFMEYGTLYSQYRFDEPWNGPHNVALAALKLFEYRCPSAPTPPKPGITNYVMLVGLHAISDGPTARRKADITDGLDNTIMLIEVAGADINWMEPRDLEVDKMTFRIKHPGNEPATDLTDISSGHPRVANVLFCDGSVRSLPDGIDPKLLEAMTTIDGGEAVDLNELSR
jgi:prepilin-type processing-associated H-X9-DG protein